MLTHVQASVRVIDLNDNQEIVPPFFLENVSDIDAAQADKAFQVAAIKSLFEGIFQTLKDVLGIDLSIRKPEHDRYDVRFNDIVVTQLSKENLQ